MVAARRTEKNMLACFRYVALPVPVWLEGGQTNISSEVGLLGQQASFNAISVHGTTKTRAGEEDRQESVKRQPVLKWRSPCLDLKERVSLCWTVLTVPRSRFST